MPTKKHQLTGRPSGYKPSFAAQAEKLCRLGATDEDIADFFSVSVRTIVRWKLQHESFCLALKSGKEHCDHRVERSLYQRAVGYTFKSEKIFNNKGAIVRAPCVEHVPPDVTAQIFWLKNRKRDEWRDKQDHEHTHNLTISQEFEGFVRSLMGGDQAKVIEHVDG